MIDSRLLRAVTLGLTLVAPASHAGSLDPILQVSQAAQREAAESQQRIDALADETRRLFDAYRAVGRQADALEVYNEQLERLVRAQQEERARLQADIDGVTAVEREIMPLMARMVETLGAFVERDVPFLLGERRSRVERLRDLLLRADVTVGEKYRRILEAFQIEAEYAHSVEAYAGRLPVRGETREVDFLRIGRVALFYRTPDGGVCGTWTGSGFEEIDGRWNDELRHGLRIARRQAPPALLLLPAPAPEEPPGAERPPSEAPE